jgi:hypothetical protein
MGIVASAYDHVEARPHGFEEITQMPFPLPTATRLSAGWISRRRLPSTDRNALPLFDWLGSW